MVSELENALRYMADRENWIEGDDGYRMKRPGGMRQEGIILVSAELVPWKFAEQALAAYDQKAQEQKVTY